MRIRRHTTHPPSHSIRGHRTRQRCRRGRARASRPGYILIANTSTLSTSSRARASFWCPTLLCPLLRTASNRDAAPRSTCARGGAGARPRPSRPDLAQRPALRSAPCRGRAAHLPHRRQPRRPTALLERHLQQLVLRGQGVRRHLADKPVDRCARPCGVRRQTHVLRPPSPGRWRRATRSWPCAARVATWPMSAWRLRRINH